MGFWDIALWIAVALSIVAGINVLRNPIRVLLNTLAGLSYFAGAGVAAALASWWPLLAGWVLSLILQALMFVRMSRGAYTEKANAARAKRGLPPYVEQSKDGRPGG